MEEAISQDQLSVMNWWRKNNSKIESPNVTKKPNRKQLLSDRQCYICGQFTGVSTENEPDWASSHSKWAQNFHAR